MPLLSDPFNLDNLTLINATSVRDYISRINDLTADDLNGRKLVLAVGTGGTISMRNEGGISKPDLNLNEVIKYTNQELTNLFHLETLDVFSVDSAEMTYQYARELAVTLGYVYQSITADIEGFLIAHGTDTMSYSASALSMMMGQGLPFSVVYTGAQKPIQEPMNDASMNIRNSLFLLEALKQADMAEVAIVMAERAMLATSSMKVDDTLIHAFDAPLHEYISKFTALEYPVRLASWLNPKRDIPFTPNIWDNDYSRTFVVHSYLGLDPEVLRTQLKSPDIQAILLFSYGAGTAHSKVIDVIHQKMQGSNIPAFVVSPVNAEYKVIYESAKAMIDTGFIPLNMTLPSALAKIEIALETCKDDLGALRKFMTENYVGEVPENSRT